MITCSNCAAENPVGNRFCGSCGNSLALMCSACGTAIPEGNRFCGNCGSPVDAAAMPAGQSESPTEDPGERRLVTVLFADLTGFTPFSENRDPEEVRNFLTEYFDRARSVVEAFGGVVDKFIGDAVMAVWGATDTHEDDAERAVRAGLELIDAIAKLGSERDVPELALRIGILTGEASVGSGGNERGLVVGDMVNTASRLQSIAEPGTVYVGEATQRAAAQGISFTPIGEQQVKGKEISVAVFRADRIVADIRGLAHSAGIEPPFVGRVDELRLLKDMIAAVGREQRTRLVSIVGQGGIGKSRLLWEFKKFLDGRVETVYWHDGRSPAYGDGVTLWALGEMVRHRARIAETDDVVTTRQLLRDAVDQWAVDGEEADWLEPRLASLLGVGEATVGDQQELFAAFRTFFERISQQGTTVLVFEDLNWADPGLLDFVEQFPDWSRDYPIFVISLARPDLLERRPGWGQGKFGSFSMHLGPLADIDVAGLVDGMLPGIDEEARNAIVERAAGIPLYAVETVRMLLATREVVEQSDGAFAFTGDAAALSVPESLQAVIGARLDRLDSVDRSLLQDCAIVGHSFTADGVAHITGIDEATLEPRLAVLVEAELLDLNRDPRSPERGQYQFVQSLIREVAHSRISREVRKERHLQVAAYLEDLGPELAPVVASHYLDAYEAASGGEAEELRVKAKDSLLAASDRAAELHSNKQARSLAESALNATADDAERAPIWERIAAAANWMADLDAAVDHAQKSIDWYRSIADSPSEYRAMRLLGDIYNDGNQSGRAIELLEPLLADVDLTDDPNLAVAAATLARAYLLADRSRKLTAAAADAALPALESFQLTQAIADAMITRGTAMGDLSRPLQGLALVRGGLEIADREGFTATSIRGRINLNYVGGWYDPQSGLRTAEEALEIAKRSGQRTMVFFLTPLMAWWYLIMGDLDAAEAVASDEIINDAPADYRGQALEVLAAISELRGDPSAAQQFFEKAEGLLANTEDEQVRLGLVRGRLTRVLSEGRFDDAFRGSMELTKSTDSVPIIQVEIAKNAAIATGNAEWLRKVVDVYIQVGSIANPYRRLVEAVLACVEDPTPAALELAEESAREFEDREPWRAIGLPFGLALHLPAGPDRDHWRDELQARCDKYGFSGIWNQYQHLSDQAH